MATKSKIAKTAQAKAQPQIKLEPSGHKWVQTSTKLVTQGNRKWHVYSCSNCGITGKVYSGKNKVTRDIQFSKPDFETCALAKVALKARADRKSGSAQPSSTGSKIAKKIIKTKAAKAQKEFHSDRYSFRPKVTDAQLKAVAERTVNEEPKGYVMLKAVMLEAAKLGIPSSRVMKAIGGNRGSGEPRNQNWEFVYYKRNRWIPKACLKELPQLAKDGRSAGRPKAEKKVAVKSDKPSKKSKAPSQPVKPQRKAATALPKTESTPVKSSKKGNSKGHSISTTRTVSKSPKPKKVESKGKLPGQKVVLKRTVSESGIPVLDLVSEDTEE